MQKIELKLPAQFKFSGLLRDVAENVFVLIELSHEWSNRFKVVLDELFNNAVEYGSNEGSHIYVTFFFNEEEVGFQVEDEGLGPKKIYPLELSEIIKKNLGELDDMEKDCGRGLALISRQWADQLKIENSERGGLLLGFKKKMVTSPSPSEGGGQNCVGNGST